jgi:hypothetical protein
LVAAEREAVDYAFGQSTLEMHYFNTTHAGA